MLRILNKTLWAACLVSLFGLVTASHAEDAQFDVYEYRVEGATLLPVTVVEQAVYVHLGEKKNVADVEKAREALERAYHGAGYLTVLVSIPEQKVNGGVVRLEVTEAPVDRLRVVGSRYYSLGEIKAAVPELAEGNVPHFPEMQKQLASLNRSGDRKITPVLRPGKTPGTVEADLKVDDQLPLHGTLELNNRQSPDTSPLRINANLRWDNLWQKQHSFGLSLQTAPQNTAESKAIAASYTVPLASGNYLALYGVHSNSNVAALGTMTVLGNGDILGARYIMPLRGRGTFSQTATLGVDYKDFDQTVALPDGGDFTTPITYMPFTAGWDGNWLEEERSTKLGVALNFNVRGVVAEESDFANKRFKALGNYAYLRGNILHSETLLQGWGLAGRGGLQLASQPLISNEQFAIGGVDTVRGYLEASAMGDNGATIGLEAFSPNFAKHLDDTLADLHFLTFFDGGQVRVLSPLPEQIERYTLSSYGVGLRLTGWKRMSAGLDWAKVLKAIGSTQAGDSRLLFRLDYTM